MAIFPNQNGFCYYKDRIQTVEIFEIQKRCMAIYSTTREYPHQMSLALRSCFQRRLGTGKNQQKVNFFQRQAEHFAQLFRSSPSASENFELNIGDLPHSRTPEYNTTIASRPHTKKQKSPQPKPLPKRPMSRSRARALQPSTSEYYLKGQGYKRAKNLEQMLSCYREGVKRQELDSIFALGLCYHVGIGVKRDFHQAVSYYNQAAAKRCIKSLRLLSLCHTYGLGVKRNLNEAKRCLQTLKTLKARPPDFIKHYFNTSCVPYLIDQNNQIVPCGTIAIVIATLCFRIVNRNAITSCLNNKQRPDIVLDVPYVSITSNGNMLIRLSEHVAQHQQLLEKLKQLGLVSKSIHLSKFGKMYVLEYQVVKDQIWDFLTDKLWINTAVYDELVEVYPQVAS